MTEAEEFNGTQATLFEIVDNEDIEFMFEAEEFENWLYKSEYNRGRKRSMQTIYKTRENVKRAFVGMGGYLSLANLKQFKRNMIDNDLSANRVNSLINGVVAYSKFLSEKYENKLIYQYLRVKTVPVTPKQYIDNVISRADFDFLIKEARKIKNPNIYLGIKIMGTTGVRLCELLQVKVEHIKHGYIDVLGKGAKRRRIYFPKNAREELTEYLASLDGGDSGYVMRYWKTKQGRQTGAYEQNTRETQGLNDTLVFQRSFQKSLKTFGQKLGLDESVMHPHGFRHFFAKEFLKNRLDISMLADLLGHSSLEITRIYLKMTSREQADIVDAVVTW